MWQWLGCWSEKWCSGPNAGVRCGSGRGVGVRCGIVAGVLE